MFPTIPKMGGGGGSVAAGVGGGSSELELGKWGGGLVRLGGGVPEPEWGEPLGEHEVWDGKGSPRPEWADPPSYRIWAVKSLPQTPNMEDPPPPLPRLWWEGSPTPQMGGCPSAKFGVGKDPPKSCPPHPPQQNPGFGVGNAPPPPPRPLNMGCHSCVPPPPALAPAPSPAHLRCPFV